MTAEEPKRRANRPFHFTCVSVTFAARSFWFRNLHLRVGNRRKLDKDYRRLNCAYCSWFVFGTVELVLRTWRDTVSLMIYRTDMSLGNEILSDYNLKPD